jgi:hypothetical protein
MIKTFPAMNGPFAVNSEQDDDMVSDYCIGKDVIYVAFAWSVTEQAYNAMFKLAKKHGVGFFDVSMVDGDILFPENGEMEALGEPEVSQKKIEDDYVTKTRWWKFW